MKSTLGSLVSIRGGGTPSKKIAEYWGGDIPWASVKDFKSSVLKSTVDYITELGVNSSATSVIPAGTIIVPTRMALGKVAITAVDMAINQDLKALVINDENTLNKKYFFHFLESQASEIEKQGKGATVKGITLDILRSIEVPLPPLTEQKRIAAILDKAAALRRKRQQAIELAECFLSSVFLTMFGPKVDRRGWPVARLGDVTILNAPMVDPREGEYLKLLHIGPDRIEKNTGRLLPALTAGEEGVISKKFLFDESYVLYSKIRPYLRKVALVDFVGLCSADMYPVKPISGKLTREYLWQLLLSDEFTRYTETLPSRASIPKLNRAELSSFELSLPPIELQNEFSDIYEILSKVMTSTVVSNLSLDDLFQSLSQRAFSGQL